MISELLNKQAFAEQKNSKRSNKSLIQNTIDGSKKLTFKNKFLTLLTD